VDIRDGGSVDGDIISPRVAIAEGAHFRGTVDMQRKGGQPQAQQRPQQPQQQQQQQQQQTPAQPTPAAAHH
jgi:cytoskeletal protein CcmA (bactofilin family)